MGNKKKVATDKHQISMYRSFYKDENSTAWIYRRVASAFEKSGNKQQVFAFTKMAETEERHADRWKKLLNEKGVDLGAFTPDSRTRLMALVLHFFGPHSLLPILLQFEKKGAGGYKNLIEAKGMEGEERAHARLIEESVLGADAPMRSHGRYERRHRTPGGNTLRAAVMGACDGLLSNFNLTMGVAGAAAAHSTVLLTGMAGLLAGAISMAIGEWISVKSSEELYEQQFANEKAELEFAPDDERDELISIYRAKGYSLEQATDLALKLMQTPDKAVQMLITEEAGADIVVEEGSAWSAALVSFFLFAAGAILPVIPYFFISDRSAIGFSAGLSLVGLFILGAVITIFTGKNMIYSGIRQVLIGCAAAGTTFLVGHFIGISLS